MTHHLPPDFFFYVVTFGPFLMVIMYVIVTYNALVRLRQQCRESWSGVDTELRRRYDLVPNLVEAVRGYATHERTVLEGVVEARNRAVASTGSAGSQARPATSATSGDATWRRATSRRPSSTSSAR